MWTKNSPTTAGRLGLRPNSTCGRCARIATIQTELGHSSPATTRKYLAAQDHNSPRRREQINAAAALVQPKSPDDVTVH